MHIGHRHTDCTADTWIVVDGVDSVDIYREALGKYRHTEAWIRVENWGQKRDTLMWTESHTHSLGRWAHLDSCRPKFYCLACSDLNLRRVGQNQQTCNEYIYF